MKIATPVIGTTFGDFVHTLPVSDQKQYFIMGEFLLFTESDFPFELNIPGVTAGWVEAQLGLEYRCQPGEAFTDFMIRNPSAAATCYVKGFVGFGRIEDRRLNVVTSRPKQFVSFQEAPTVIQGNEVSAAAASEVSYDGAQPSNRSTGRRKSLILTNLDTTNSLEIGRLASNAAPISKLLPLEKLQLDTSDVIYVRNASGSTVIYRWLAVVYQYAA